MENDGMTIKGRGSQLNTKNRFLKKELVAEHIEGLDEQYDLNRKTEYYYEHPKKIINGNDSPDVAEFSMNPYQGCEHGCVYCYARNVHEYWGFSAGMDFEQKIIIKPEAPQLLEKDLSKKSWQPSMIMLSGNTDCYQPVERKMQLTRRMLEVLLKFRNPVGIITKNSLILRDIDLLKELAALKLVTVMVSLTTLDEDLRQKMEPRTATSVNRLKVVETLNANGIPCGVMTAPIIPGLNSHEIPMLIKKAGESGAVGAGYTIVRLNGAVGAIFTDWIKKTFPDRAEKVLNQIAEVHGGQINDSRFGVRMRGEGKIAEAIRQLFKSSVKKHLAGRGFPEYDYSIFNRDAGKPQMSLF
jgi:DNA repair photolyase